MALNLPHKNNARPHAANEFVYASDVIGNQTLQIMLATFQQECHHALLSSGPRSPEIKTKVKCGNNGKF